MDMKFKNTSKIFVAGLSVLAVGTLFLLSSCSSQKIDIQAHRGGAGLMPENTIPAMINAIDLGVNTLEFDLQVSKDGKVVVSHDRYFHPRYSIRPDGSYIQKGEPKEYIYTMPYDSVAKYEVGMRKTERWPNKKLMHAVKPLVVDLIDSVETYTAQNHLTPMNYNIEIKSTPGKTEGKNWPEYKDFVDICMSAVPYKKLGDRLIIQSFDVRALKYLHEKYPEVILAYLTDSDNKEPAKNIEVLGFTPQWDSPHHRVINKTYVEKCHKLGMKVVPWTVDNRQDIERVIDSGCDAIISNYPDVVIGIVKK